MKKILLSLIAILCISCTEGLQFDWNYGDEINIFDLDIPEDWYNLQLQCAWLSRSPLEYGCVTAGPHYDYKPNLMLSSRVCGADNANKLCEAYQNYREKDKAYIMYFEFDYTLDEIKEQERMAKEYKRKYIKESVQ